MKIKQTRSGDKVEIQMTPMIDIVFQLLTFFVFSLKITTAEGDFGIKMPVATSAGVADSSLQSPIKIRLTSNLDGGLAGMQLNDRPITSFEILRLEIISMLGDQRGPGTMQETAEVELDCDSQLNYEHVIDAITAVSGYVDDNRNLIKLVEKIKFAPPRGG